MEILLKLLMISGTTALYTCGEIYKKELKYICGIPMGILGCVVMHSPIPLLAILSYFIATEFGYGENNWLTKLLGNLGAITFCGVAFGLASIPILGLWGLLQGLLSGGVWYYLAKKDGVINEPWVGIFRSLLGCILTIGA